MTNENLPVLQGKNLHLPQEPCVAGLVAVAPPGSCEPSFPLRILRLPEVMARVGLCRASIYQYIARGDFPKQVILGPRCVGWLEHEIAAWLASRIQRRR
jgi:prophage regulatory protein